MRRRGIDKRVPPTHTQSSLQRRHATAHTRASSSAMAAYICAGSLRGRFSLCGIVVVAVVVLPLFVLFFSSGIIQSPIDEYGMRHRRQQSALSRHLGITKDKGVGLRDILKSFNFNRCRFPRKQHHNNTAGATQTPHSFMLFPFKNSKGAAGHHSS